MEVIVEAKKEYTNKLNTILSSYMISKINECYHSENDTLEELRDIPEWNNSKVTNFINQIKEKYNFLDELVTAVFISHVKILSSVKINEKKQTIKLKVPDIDVFIHKVLSNFAEVVYYNNSILPLKKENGNKILSSCIENTISELLPFETILNMYIKEDESSIEDEENSDSDEPETNESEEPEVNEIQEPENTNNENEFSELMNDIPEEEPKTVPLDNSNVKTEQSIPEESKEEFF